MLAQLTINTNIKKRKKQQQVNQLNFLTAADHNYFVALQFLVVSLREYYPNAKIVCIDLGLSLIEIAWLKEYKIELQKPVSLPMPRSIHYWQTWNKPQYILQQGVGNWLWLDADTIILDTLPFIERNIKNYFTVFTDTIAFKCEGDAGRNRIRNNNAFDVLRPEQYPNAGIIAFNIKRDKKILKAWYEKVTLAARSSVVYNNLKCYDQGALQLIIEENNFVEFIIHNEVYNYGINQDFFTNIFEFYTYIYYLKQQGVKIVHFFYKPIYRKLYFNRDIHNTLRRKYITERNFEQDILLSQQTKHSPQPTGPVFEPPIY